MKIGALMLAAFLAGPVCAQDSAAGLGADPSLLGHAAKEGTRNPVTRLGLAVSLAFDATTWTSIGVSSPPARAATDFIRRGHYRLELLQLVLMARDSDGRLLDLTRKRSEGASLRSLAEAAKLSYDSVYTESERLAALVDRRLREVERVRAGKPVDLEAEERALPPEPVRRRGRWKKR